MCHARQLHIPRQITILLHLPGRKPIAHKPEPIGTRVLNIPVFPTNLLHHPAEQNRAAAEQRHNTAVCRPPLVPALAAARPYKRLMHLLAVLHECLLRVQLGLDGLDVFRGDLADPLHEVIACPVEGLDQGAVPAETVGAHHDEVVWEAYCRDGQVCLRIDVPLVGQSLTVFADDWEMGNVRDIEAGGADDCPCVSRLLDWM